MEQRSKVYKIVEYSWRIEDQNHGKDKKSKKEDATEWKNLLNPRKKMLESNKKNGQSKAKRIRGVANISTSQYVAGWI